MAKIYYNVELQNGYSFSCVHEDPTLTVSFDYKNLLNNNCKVWDTHSILHFLLDKTHHIDPNYEKLVKGDFVVSVSKPFFVPDV